MPIITLTTDLGLKDHYVASVKGAILSQIPDINIVDITHNIDAFNISQTAYVIRNCYKNFPAGSIHILGVDAELSIDNSHLAVFAGGHYFIGTDNGTFPLLFDDLKAKYDYEEHGGTPLLGVNGISIVCHGSSGPKSIMNSIFLGQKCIENNLIEDTQKSLAIHFGH